MKAETFSFGKNWREFVGRYWDRERVDIAARHMAEFLDVPDLQGKSFVDIGCGSGLSSLAAYQLGAAEITSFDVDLDSVLATRKIRENAGNPAHWTVCQGSVLDRDFIDRLQRADVVYSWGVLHHTGHMWEALNNTTCLLSDNGVLYISIYVTTSKSAYWTRVKRTYNAAPALGKRLLEIWFILWYKGVHRLARFRNPLRELQQYKQGRGMEYMTDIRDWLGGYPYEHATIEEILRFARRTLQLELVNIGTGEAAIEYLFGKCRMGTEGNL